MGRSAEIRPVFYEYPPQPGAYAELPQLLTKTGVAMQYLRIVTDGLFRDRLFATDRRYNDGTGRRDSYVDTCLVYSGMHSDRRRRYIVMVDFVNNVAMQAIGTPDGKGGYTVDQMMLGDSRHSNRRGVVSPTFAWNAPNVNDLPIWLSALHRNARRERRSTPQESADLIQRGHRALARMPDYYEIDQEKRRRKHWFTSSFPPGTFDYTPQQHTTAP